MNVFHRVCLTSLVLFAGNLTANAQIAGFDRRAEVAEITALMRTASREEATLIAQRIYYSGLSDPQLAAVVNERLVREYPSFSLEQRRGKVYVDDQYGRWMVKALASFGLVEYRSTFENMARRPKEGGCPVRRVSGAAVRESRQIEWHAKKNRVMGDASNHTAGDDERVTQLVNLLRDPDPSLQLFGFTRMRSRGSDDPRFTATLSEQLAAFADGAPLGDEESIAMHVRRIKALRDTGDRSYVPLLQRVAAMQTDKRIKRHAEVAIERLTTSVPTDDADDVADNEDDDEQ